jgi:hypothetical protein
VIARINQLATHAKQQVNSVRSQMSRLHRCASCSTNGSGSLGVVEQALNNADDFFRTGGQLPFTTRLQQRIDALNTEVHDRASRSHRNERPIREVIGLMRVRVATDHDGGSRNHLQLFRVADRSSP